MVPYYIFIKGISDKSDIEILNILGLEKGKLVENWWKTEDDSTYLFLFREGDWVHIMDNVWYTFWHSSKLDKQVEKLGTKYELFTCSYGEPDESFDFKYFKGGKKIREYIVSSPNYADQIVTVDFGRHLKGEHEGLRQPARWLKVLYIAKTLGIQPIENIFTDIAPEKITCYDMDISSLE